MAYEIKAIRVDGETMSVDVQYDFLDTLTCVAIWQPKTKADITLAIENRQVSEQAKLDQKAINDQLKAELDAEIA